MKPAVIRGLTYVILLMCGCNATQNQSSATRPNILLVMTDDQSWEHAGAYGDEAVRTPYIDALAAEGVRFIHAYTAAPSCSPSRAGLLTGQDIYRLEEGGVLTGFIRQKFDVFPRLLEEAGYVIGSTGKPYWPRTPDVEGAHDLPAGPRWTSQQVEPPEGISRHDYAGNFSEFLKSVPEDSPFFFWVGISEPHLPHPEGLGVSSGIDPAEIRVPAFYPDAPEIREALADYMAEIEWADDMLGRILALLDENEMRENTLVVFTSDNGMPFPRAKATLYDHGVRTPLIVSWPGITDGNRVIDTPVSLIDLAPTFLEVAGIDPPEQMTGRSLRPLIASESSLEPALKRDFVVTVFEKHVLARPDSLGFPRRAIHTQEWTYIRNYEPDRFPAGNADYFVPGWDVYGDIDPSRIKTFLMNHRDDPEVGPLFELGFGKVPEEELYHKLSDLDMMTNLAENADYQEVMEDLRGKLSAYLEETNDPRFSGLSPWDDYNLDK